MTFVMVAVMICRHSFKMLKRCLVPIYWFILSVNLKLPYLILVIIYSKLQ